MAHRSRVLRASWFYAACYGVFVFAEPANARPDHIAGRGWSGLTQDVALARKGLDRSPNDNRYLSRQADWQRSQCQFGDDKPLARSPLARSSYVASPCLTARRVETELVGHNDSERNSWSVAANPTSLPPPSNFSDYSVTPATNRALPFSGGTWLILATVLLLGITLYASGTAVLWFFALAGYLVGGTSFLFNLTWRLQLIVFAISGIALVVLWVGLDRQFRRRNDVRPLGSANPSALVGRVFELQNPIVNGIGMLTIGGTIWRVACNNCAVGERVLVRHAEGTLLVVDPLEVEVRDSSSVSTMIGSRRGVPRKDRNQRREP